MKNSLTSQFQDWKNKNSLKKMSSEELEQAISLKKEEIASFEKNLEELKLQKEELYKQAEAKYLQKEEKLKNESLSLMKEIVELQNEHALLEDKRKRSEAQYEESFAELDAHIKQLQKSEKLKAEQYEEQIEDDFKIAESQLLKQIKEAKDIKEFNEKKYQNELAYLEDLYKKQIEDASIKVDDYLKEEKIYEENQKAALNAKDDELQNLKKEFATKIKELEENYMSEKQVINQENENRNEQLKAELLELMKRHEELNLDYKEKEEDFKRTQNSLIAEYDQMIQTFDKKRLHVELEKEKLISDLQRRKEEFKVQIQKQKEEYAKKSGEVETIQQLFQNEQKEKHEEFLREYEQLSEDLKDQYDRYVGNYGNKVQALKKSYDEKIQELRKQYNDEVKRNNDRLEYLENSKAQTKKELEFKLQSVYDQQKAVHARILEEETLHQSKLSDLTLLMANEQKDFDTKYREKANHYESELSQLKQKYQVEQDEILSQIENEHNRLLDMQHKIVELENNGNQEIEVLELNWERKGKELDLVIENLNKDLKNEHERIALFEKDLEQNRANYDAEVLTLRNKEENVRQAHKEALRQISDAHLENEQNLKAEFEEKEKELALKHQQNIDNIKEEYNKREETLLRQFEDLKKYNEENYHASHLKLEEFKENMQNEISREQVVRSELLSEYSTYEDAHKKEITELEESIDQINRDHIASIHRLEKDYEDRTQAIQAEKDQLFIEYKEKAFELEQELSAKTLIYDENMQYFKEKRESLEKRMAELLSTKEKETNAVENEIETLRKQNEEAAIKAEAELAKRSEEVMQLQNELEDLKLDLDRKYQAQVDEYKAKLEEFKANLKTQFDAISNNYKNNEETYRSQLASQFEVIETETNQKVQKINEMMQSNESRQSQEMNLLKNRLNSERETTTALKEKFEAAKFDAESMKQDALERFQRRKIEVQQDLKDRETELDLKVNYLQKELDSRVEQYIHEQSLKEVKIANMQKEMISFDERLKELQDKNDELEALNRSQLESWIEETENYLTELHEEAERNDAYVLEQLKEFDDRQAALIAEKDDLLRNHSFALSSNIQQFELDVRNEKEVFDQKVMKLKSDYERDMQNHRNQREETFKLLKLHLTDAIAKREDHTKALRANWTEMNQEIERLIQDEKNTQASLQMNYATFEKESSAQMQKINASIAQLETYYEKEKERLELAFDQSKASLEDFYYPEASYELNKKRSELELKHQELNNRFLSVLNDLRIDNQKLIVNLENEIQNLRQYYSEKAKEREEEFKKKDLLGKKGPFNFMKSK